MFHHPLIRTVAYESQLKSDRSELHRRVAAAIEGRGPASADENAALIAEHLEDAGDLHAAYGWHMRAATWATNRDIAAARLSWERARKIADALPTEDPPGQPCASPHAPCCASPHGAECRNSSPATSMSCGSCARAGDKASLAIAMTGLSTELMWHGRAREASRLASEQMALLESIGDATLTIGAAYVPITIKINTGEIADALRWSQTVIDLAEGDPAKGANLAMDRRWRGRWHTAASLDIGWAVLAGARTSATPWRWPEQRPGNPCVGRCSDIRCRDRGRGAAG